MIGDAIVEEVRAARDAFAKEFNYDIDAICAHLREQEKDCGHPVVSLPPNRITPTTPTRR